MSLGLSVLAFGLIRLANSIVLRTTTPRPTCDSENDIPDERQSRGKERDDMMCIINCARREGAILLQILLRTAGKSSPLSFPVLLLSKDKLRNSVAQLSVRS